MVVTSLILCSQEEWTTYSFSCLVSFTTWEASDMQVSTTTRYREHSEWPWCSALWEGFSPAWFCMVTFAPYSTKVCQKLQRCDHIKMYFLMAPRKGDWNLSCYSKSSYQHPQQAGGQRVPPHTKENLCKLSAVSIRQLPSELTKMQQNWPCIRPPPRVWAGVSWGGRRVLPPWEAALSRAAWIWGEMLVLFSAQAHTVRDTWKEERVAFCLPVPVCLGSVLHL